MEPKLHKWVQRSGWDRASSSYETYWQRQLRPAIAALLNAADLRPGELVLDVACGTGLATLPAAASVGPNGRVMATDLSPKMIADLERSAATAGLLNVDVACCDAEDLRVDGPFDVAMCSLGLMYFPSPQGALRQLFRSLRPGGRVVVSVWGERRHCGWAGLFPIVDARVASEVCPMFFALGAPDVLAASLERAGFGDVQETRLRVDLEYADDLEAVGAAFLGGPVALAASRFDERTRLAAHEEYLGTLAAFAVEGGYRVPGEFVIASATRPGVAVPTPSMPAIRTIHRPTSNHQKGIHR